MLTRITILTLALAFLMPPTAQADDNLKVLREQGDEMLEDLPDIPKSLNKTTYYEVLHKTIHIPEYRMGGRGRDRGMDEAERLEQFARYKTVGWLKSTLKSTKFDDELCYELSTEFTFDVPEGPAAVGHNKVIMNESFMPLKYDGLQDVVSVYFGTAKTMDRIVTHDKKMTCRRILDAIERPKKELQRIPGDFVYGCEPFIESLDLERGQKFAFADFDPNSRMFGFRTYHVKRLKKSRRKATGAEFRVSVKEFRLSIKGEVDKEKEESGPEEGDKEEKFEDPDMIELKYESITGGNSNDAGEREYYLVDKKGKVIESGNSSGMMIILRKVDKKKFNTVKKNTHF